jgi:hypothetical protein
MPIFNATTQAQRSAIDKYLESRIKAPEVRVHVSTLGGVARADAIVSASLDKKSTWANGIYQNSRYFQIMIGRDGTVEMFQKSYKIPAKAMRKSKVASLPDAVTKINKWIAGAK